MMWKLSWMSLVLSIYSEDEKSVFFGSTKELEWMTAKKIIWKQDGTKVTPISSGNLTRSLFLNVVMQQFLDPVRFESIVPLILGVPSFYDYTSEVLQ